MPSPSPPPPVPRQHFAATARTMMTIAGLPMPLRSADSRWVDRRGESSPIILPSLDGSQSGGGGSHLPEEKSIGPPPGGAEMCGAATCAAPSLDQHDEEEGEEEGWRMRATKRPHANSRSSSGSDLSSSDSDLSSDSAHRPPASDPPLPPSSPSLPTDSLPPLTPIPGGEQRTRATNASSIPLPHRLEPLKGYEGEWEGGGTVRGMTRLLEVAERSLHKVRHESSPPHLARSFPTSAAPSYTPSTLRCSLVQF